MAQMGPFPLLFIAIQVEARQTNLNGTQSIGSWLVYFPGVSWT